jgi:hypothetical protein
MTEALFGRLKSDEALQQVARWVEEYVAGGPDRRAESLKLLAPWRVNPAETNRIWDVGDESRAEALKAELARTEAELARRLAEPAPEPEQITRRALASAYCTKPQEGEVFISPKIQSKEEDEAKAQPEPKPEPKRAEPEPEPEPEKRKELVTQGQRSVIQRIVSEPVGAWVPEEVKDLNEKHAVISNLGGKCVVMEWIPSVITPGGTELSYQNFTNFKERYANLYIDMRDGKGRVTSLPAAPVWLSHPQRRQYEGLDLVPNGPAVLKGNYLNLWRGFGVVPCRGSWRLMQRHIAEVLANGDQEFEDYILRSTAWKFQNPGAPPEVVLALLGGKGAGKGVWGYAQMLIWGQHGLQIFSTEHLCGKHNAHLQNKLFLFLDEAMWAGDRDADRVLKGITTEKWMMIEPKGINAFQWPNRLGVYMSGNDKWIVPASHDERRYAVNKISERWKQNKDYFGPLFDEVNNGGAAAMLWDLLQLDLDGWHPRDNVPQTKALVEQKMLGLTGLQQWYVEKLSVGELPMPNAKNPRYALTKHLIEDAKVHNQRNRYVTDTEFGLFLRDEVGCQHKSNGKAWGWVFPPLAEARAAWLAKVGGGWDWLADIEDWGQKA